MRQILPEDLGQRRRLISLLAFGRLAHQRACSETSLLTRAYVDAFLRSLLFEKILLWTILPTILLEFINILQQLVIIIIMLVHQQILAFLHLYLAHLGCVLV